MDEKESVLLELLRDEDDGLVLLGDWIVIGEVYDREGMPYIASNANEGSTFWKQLGMLQVRKEMLKEKGSLDDE